MTSKKSISLSEMRARELELLDKLDKNWKIREAMKDENRAIQLELTNIRYFLNKHGIPTDYKEYDPVIGPEIVIEILKEQKGKHMRLKDIFAEYRKRHGKLSYRGLTLYMQEWSADYSKVPILKISWGRYCYDLLMGKKSKKNKTSKKFDNKKPPE